MKTLVGFFFIIIGCTSSKPISTTVDKCLIIQVILDQKDINAILNLENTVEWPNPSIRLFDLSKKLKSCNSFYQQKNSKILIPYVVDTELKPSINTGHYRDLVIHNFNFNNGKGRVVLSVAQFTSSHNKRTNFRIVLKFCVDRNNQIKITNTVVTDYDDFYSDDYDNG